MVAYWHHQHHPALPMIDGGQQHHCGLRSDWGGENLLVLEYRCAMMVSDARTELRWFNVAWARCGVTVPRRTRLAVDQSILLRFLFLHRRGPLCPLLHGFPHARGLALPTTISRRAFMFHHVWLWCDQACMQMPAGGTIMAARHTRTLTLARRTPGFSGELWVPTNLGVGGRVRFCRGPLEFSVRNPVHLKGRNPEVPNEPRLV